MSEPPGEAGPSRRWLPEIAAPGVLVLGLLVAYHALLAHDPARFVPVHVGERALQERGVGFGSWADQRFVVWLIARNARTWLSDPRRLFDGEICHPTPLSIALGEPALTLGLLATPALLLSPEPILHYDFAIVASTLLGALAMYLLVRQWTGLPAAALAAALLYGFHPLKIGDPVHPYVADSAGTVLALYFYRAWLEQGRWRQMLGLALGVALQLGGSLYALLGAAALGLPFAAWGALRIGLRRTRPAQWAVLLALLALGAVGVFAPYASQLGGVELQPRRFQTFLPWSTLFEPGRRGLGPPLLLLASLAFLPRRWLPAIAGLEARVPLAIGLMLVLALATGGNQAARDLAIAAGERPPPALPNLFHVLAAALPPLTIVRLPAAIAHASYLALAILAGLGTARLLAALPLRRRGLAAVVLNAVLFVDTLRPGLPGGADLGVRALRPPDAAIAFYEELAARGDAGPLLELPQPRRPHPRYGRSILLAAYHGRRTSSCYNSFLPRGSRRLRELGQALPQREAAMELSQMGFRTVVLHHDEAGASHPLRDRRRPWLVPIHEDGERSAWRLAPEALQE